ncbi:MAG: SLC13 family permease [Planctomycetota bacterium]
MDPILLSLLAIVLVIVSVLALRLHPFLALIFAALLVTILTPQERLHDAAISKGAEPAAAQKMSEKPAGQRLAEGFGDTCRKIGILIAMASVIGTCLLESGAARRIVDWTRELVGERRTPLAFAASGFIVGIPVFFDTVFYLLMPLAKAMYRKEVKNYLLYVMSIVVGATMAHSLVPPTPGPLLVASEIKGVTVGQMILGHRRHRQLAAHWHAYARVFQVT